ncbi:hypothetical protein [Streptomyces sp. 147326]
MCVGGLLAIDRTPARVLVVTATGRGPYSRRADGYAYAHRPEGPTPSA